MPQKKTNKSKYLKVLVFGTFDLLHPGHKYFLRQAKKYGDQLFVVVTRDHIVFKQKGRRPYQNQFSRINALKKIKFINKILLGQAQMNHHYALVFKIKPSVLCLGYDQGGSVKKIREHLRLKKLNTSVIRLGSFFPARYKSSLIRHRLRT